MRKRLKLEQHQYKVNQEHYPTFEYNQKRNKNTKKGVIPYVIDKQDKKSEDFVSFDLIGV